MIEIAFSLFRLQDTEWKYVNSLHPPPPPPPPTNHTHTRTHAHTHTHTHILSLSFVSPSLLLRGDESNSLLSCSVGRIEKSREVIPTLLEAARTKPKNAELNWKEAYRLLFTRDNLKLVQVGCHKKAARADKECSVKDFLVM